MIVNEKLYKRMILYIAEMNNCYDENIYKNFGITWMQLHRLRKEIEGEEE
jgi:hypothetical protein